MSNLIYRSSPQLALRLVLGLASIGMLLEHAPWAQHTALLAADGYLGFLAIGTWAVTGAESRWSRTMVITIGIAWLAVIACKLSGLSA